MNYRAGQVWKWTIRPFGENTNFEYNLLLEPIAKTKHDWISLSLETGQTENIYLAAPNWSLVSEIDSLVKRTK